MKKQVYITWEHGDADGKTSESYEVKDVNSFLNFISEVRRPNIKGFGHECNTRDHLEAIEEKYPEYRDMIPYDMFSSRFIPSVDEIWLKLGRKHFYIVWENFLNPVELPEIGSKIDVSIGHIVGKSMNFPNIKTYSDYVKKMIPVAEGYPLLSGTVKEIKMQEMNYKKDGISQFTYDVLIQVGEDFVVTTLNGYNKKFNDSVNLEDLYNITLKTK